MSDKMKELRELGLRAIADRFYDGFIEVVPEELAELVLTAANVPVLLDVVEVAREISLEDIDDIDPRLDYVHVQVDRDAWKTLLRTLAALDGAEP